jgi:hypothetical protein
MDETRTALPPGFRTYLTIPSGTTVEQISNYIAGAGFVVPLENISVLEFNDRLHCRMASAIVVFPHTELAKMVNYLCGGRIFKVGWPELEFRHQANSRPVTARRDVGAAPSR